MRMKFLSYSNSAKTRRNPTLIIDGIKYYYESDEFIGLGPQKSSRSGCHPFAKDLFEDILRNFAKILRRKFPTIIPIVPLIILENNFFENTFKQKKNSASGILATYNIDDNLIYVNYSEFVENFFYEITTLQNKKELITFYTRYLNHELGHFVWFKYLMLSENFKKRSYFINYVDKHMKDVNLSYLKKLASENSERKLQTDFTVEYAIIISLINRMEDDGIKLPPKIGQYISEYLEIYTDNYKNYFKNGFRSVGRTPKAALKLFMHLLVR